MLPVDCKDHKIYYTKNGLTMSECVLDAVSDSTEL